MRVDAGSLEAIPVDRCVSIAGGRAVIARVGDTVVAFQNRCLHQDSPLTGGRVTNGVLTCPLHFWRYRLPEVEHTGGGGALPTYPVEIISGTVVVDLPEPAPPMSMRGQLLRHAREWSRDDPPGPPNRDIANRDER